MGNLESFVNGILVLFLILMSGSILYVGFPIPTYIFFLFIVVCSIIERKFHSRRELLLTMSYFSIFTMILILNFTFSSSHNFGNYFTVIALGALTFLVIYSLKLRKVDFKWYLYRVLKYIMILSLVGLFLSIFEIGLPFRFEDGYSVNTIGYVFYYFWNVSVLGLHIYRNQGFFWEPGVLSVYANLFLFLSLFVYKDRKNVTLSIICILSTFSTTGFFVLLIQLVVFFRKAKLNFKKKAYVVFGLIVMTFFLSLSFLEKKDGSDESANSSYGMRTFDLYSGFMVAVTNPFFGVGLNKEAFFIERNKFIPAEISDIFELIEERGNSNSIMQLFYCMGFVVSFLFLYLLYKQSVFDEHRMLFFFIMVISLSSEPLLFSPFFMFFIFSGFFSSSKKNVIV